MDVSLSDDITFPQRPRLTQIVVAIPVRNEARRLGRLLGALANAAGRSALPVTVVVFANNCTDRSAAIAREHGHPLLTVEVQEAELADATAGAARRIAFEMAAREGALILTTDGDAVPHADWIAAALRSANAGADVVCGRISADCRRVMACPGDGRRLWNGLTERCCTRCAMASTVCPDGRDRPGPITWTPARPWRSAPMPFRQSAACRSHGQARIAPLFIARKAAA